MPHQMPNDLRQTKKGISTGLFIYPKYWHSRKQKVLEDAEQSEYINKQLSLIINKMNQAFLLLQVQESSFNVDDIYVVFKGEKLKKEYNTVEYFEVFLAQLKRLVGIGLKQATWQKLFRLIRQNLLMENKTGRPALPVGRYLKYAIGEIILVVVGILIALQINNWNEQRKENNYEQKILKELKSDFLYNKRELNINIKEANTLVNNCDSLIVLFSLSKENVDLNKFVHFTKRLKGYSTFDPSNGALNNLISSGNLNIIKSDSLRKELSRWSGMLQDVKEDEKRLIDFGDTQMDPLTLPYINLNPKSKFVRIESGLLENRRFENMVMTVRSSANYILKNYKILDLEIDSMLDDMHAAMISKQ